MSGKEDEKTRGGREESKIWEGWEEERVRDEAVLRKKKKERMEGEKEGIGSEKEPKGRRECKGREEIELEMGGLGGRRRKLEVEVYKKENGGRRPERRDARKTGKRMEVRGRRGKSEQVQEEEVAER